VVHDVSVSECILSLNEALTYVRQVSWWRHWMLWTMRARRTEPVWAGNIWRGLWTNSNYTSANIFIRKCHSSFMLFVIHFGLFMHVARRIPLLLWVF